MSVLDHQPRVREREWEGSRKQQRCVVVPTARPRELCVSVNEEMTLREEESESE